MSYWKASEALINSDGTAITIEFKDAHSCSHYRMTLPTEIWKDILTFKAAYDEPDRRMFQAHTRLIEYWRNTVEAKLENKTKEA